MTIKDTFAQQLIKVSEMYHFVDAAGTDYFVTSYNKKFTFQSNEYIPLAISRTSSSFSSSMDVGEIRVTIPALPPLDVDAILNDGLFDNGTLIVYQVDRDDPVNNWRRVFSGNVATVDVNKNNVEVVCRDELNMLLKRIPRRMYSESCPFKLGDVDCKIVLATFKDTGTAGAGSTGQVILDFVTTRPDDYFRGGYLVITSGANAGARLPIVEYKHETFPTNKGTITLLTSLGFDPTGETFDIFPHCEKSRIKCESVFNNLVNFGAFEYIPRPEEAYT